MKKFGKKNKAFCHGDLTFENIVFDIKNNKVYFLDWENFEIKRRLGLRFSLFIAF